MSSDIQKVDIASWVEVSRPDPIAYAGRQATEVLLVTIAMTEVLSDTLFLKGGMLMGLAYQSPRQTNDVDLTTTMTVTADSIETIKDALNENFPRAAAKLGYADLVLKVQTIKKLPRKKGFEEQSFPAIKMKIGYAKRGSKQAEKLIKKEGSSTVIDADITFNEPLQAIQILQLTNDDGIRAYGLTDLVAEKLRAMLQQVIRNRFRRQDVYDLAHLIKSGKIQESHYQSILSAFIEKSNSRDIYPNIGSLDDGEVKRRSKENWETLKQEIGELPDFEESFEVVRALYQSLPWK